MQRVPVPGTGIITIMDATLEKRWKAGEAPFDGVTLHDGEGEIPLGKLREAVARVLDLLETRYAAAGLVILDDWHEHDGFICAGSNISWTELRNHLSSKDAFLKFKTGDFQVARGVYPKEMQFLLRIYIEEDSGPDVGAGDMDVTVPVELGDTMAEALTRSGLTPKAVNAKAFFDERFGG